MNVAHYSVCKINIYHRDTEAQRKPASDFSSRVRRGGRGTCFLVDRVRTSVKKAPAAAHGDHKIQKGFLCVSVSLWWGLTFRNRSATRASPRRRGNCAPRLVRQRRLRRNGTGPTRLSR